MKRHIDLAKAADAEGFGALAISPRRKHRTALPGKGTLTESQKRVLSDLALGLVRMARSAGANNKRIVLGGVSFELQQSGGEEILSIRTGVPHAA